jgi:recombination protein RecT
MAAQTNAPSNTLTQKSKPRFSVFMQSDTVKNLINTTLQDPKRAQRFSAAIVSAVSANPKLQECEATTVLSSALLGEALNLSPSSALGQYWLIPYKNNKTGVSVCQFQLGVNGYKQLAMRSGQYLDIDAIEVREGEYKGRDKQTGKPVFEFFDDDDVRESLPIIGYLAYFELLNGFKKNVYFSMEKMMKHADKYSQAFSRKTYEDIQAGKIPQTEIWKYSSPWYTDFNGQALKTVLKNLLSKWGILSIELQNAVEYDQGVGVIKDGKLTGVEYVDNTEDEIVIEPVSATESVQTEDDPFK